MTPPAASRIMSKQSMDGKQEQQIKDMNHESLLFHCSNRSACCAPLCLFVVSKSGGIFASRCRVINSDHDYDSVPLIVRPPWPF